MLDAPLDATLVWLGLAAASAVALGTALQLPAAPPPDAAAVADTVDRVAASPHPSTAAQPVVATAVRVGPDRVSLRSPAGTAHAPLAYGPVTPVRDGSALDAVLHGTPPARAFDSPADFRRAAASALNDTPAWQPVDDHVLVRRVTWRGVDVTLVGA